MLGFSFHETMRGTYYMLDAPTDERAIAFTIDAKVDRLRKFLKDKEARIDGEVSAEGLATKARLRGTLGLRLVDQQRLPYDFAFTGDDGVQYRFRGQKDVTPIALAESMTVLPASLYDTRGHEIGRALLRFDLRNDLGRFLRSWRLRFLVLGGGGDGGDAPAPVG